MFITPEDIKIVVNPDPTTFIYTGTTLQNAVGSGNTEVTISGQTIIIYSATGGTASWGNVSGTLSDQTDLQNALNAKLATTVFNSYTGDTQSELNTLSASTETNESNIDILSGLTTIHTSQINYISGQTDNKLATTDFITFSGDTNSKINYISGVTDTKTETGDFVGAGGTSVVVSGDSVIISSATPTGTTVSWGNITGTLADQTDLKNALDAKLNISDFNTYTGDTQIVLQSYDDDLTTLFNDVSELETYTGETETRLTGIESDILDLETNTVYALTFNTYTGETETRLTGIEDDITTLDGQVIYLSGQTDLRLEITDFNTYTGATETELNALETDKLETTDFNTYTGATETELLALDTEFDNYVPSSGGTFTGELQGTDLQLSGTLTANKITSVYTEDVLVKDQYVYLRSGATTGLGVGEIAGVAALNVDGLGTTAIMGVTNDGLIRVGWSGDTLQAVATREDSPINLGIATWSNTLEMFVTTGMTMPELQGLESDLAIVSGNTDTNETNITALESDFDAHTGDTDIHYAQSAITITESQVSGLTADLADKLDTTVYATYTGETETRLTGIEGDISTNISDIGVLNNDKANKTATINTVTTSQNISTSWSNEIVEASGDITLTFPTDLDYGFQITVVNTGTGTITFAGATGVTLRSKDSAVTIANQYEAVSAYVNNDTVTLVGGLT